LSRPVPTRYHFIMLHEDAKGKPEATVEGFLQGQLLIAMPGIGDPRFDRSVIYVCSHSEQGAMGIIVNKPAHGLTFAELLTQVGIALEEKYLEHAGLQHAGLGGDKPILLGGPVEPGRGFVLHSRDYASSDSSLPVSDGIAMTATVDILRAMARGTGPERSLVALGYAGWAPGQLEAEIQENGWLTCKAEEHVLFSDSLELKYERALAELGIDLSLLSAEAGHA